MSAVFRTISILLSSLAVAAPITAPYEIWERIPGWPKDHPGHAPFISFLTFRSICDHQIDQVREFDPDVIHKGDLVYLNCWYLPWFVNQIHPRIKEPYILVTCDTNTWIPFPGLLNLILDPKCAAWFCRHMIFSGHPKLFQIPMGQDFYYFDPGLVRRDALLKLVPLRPPKEHLLYLNFFARPKHDRQRIVQLFENAPYCFSRNQSGQDWNPIHYEQFYREIAASQFVLSPWGVEFDAVRTWESFVLGSIPIVEHSFLDPLFKDLPILLIHDWSEVDENLLKQSYERLKGKSIEKAYFAYWSQLIKETQRKVRHDEFMPSENLVFSATDLADIASMLDQNTSPFIYRGNLTLSRPLQLALHIHSPIKLYDRWHDPQILFCPKIQCTIQNESDFEKMLQTEGPTTLFLDLTYHRSGLLRNDDVLTKDWELIRHSLKEDLYALFNQLALGSTIIGNMVQDEYVEQVLGKIEKERNWVIEKRGHFWKIRKTLKELIPQFSESVTPFSLREAFPFDVIGQQRHNAIELGPDSNLLASQIADPSKPIDLIFFSGATPSIYTDLQRWFPLLSQKGVLLGDGWSSIQSEVIRFAREKRLYITYKNDCWLLKSFIN